MGSKETYGLSGERFTELTEGRAGLSVDETRTFPEATIYDTEGGVYYVPFVTFDGRVGYIVRVTATGDQETHIYLNPSQSEGEGDANVFVYMGGENDPAVDLALHHYLTDPRLEGSPGDTAR